MSHHTHQSLPPWPRPIRRMALAKAFGEPCSDPAAVPMGPCAGHGHGAAPDHETSLTCGEGVGLRLDRSPGLCASGGRGGHFPVAGRYQAACGQPLHTRTAAEAARTGFGKPDLSQEPAQDVVALPEQYGGTGRPKWRVSGAAGGPPDPADASQGASPAERPVRISPDQGPAILP